MERTFEITRQFVRRLFCDKCESVEMQQKAPTIALHGQPPRHTYRCPVCASTIVTTNMYPAMMTEVEELVEPKEENKEVLS